MKKNITKALIAGFVLTILLSSICTAQKRDAVKIPAVVRESFKKSFAGATGVKWQKADKNYKADFAQDSKIMAAVINSQGLLLQTEVSIKVSELPATVLEYIEQNYKEEKIKEATVIKKINGEMNYKTVLNNKDILFSSQGEFIKEVKV